MHDPDPPSSRARDTSRGAAAEPLAVLELRRVARRRFFVSLLLGSALIGATLAVRRSHVALPILGVTYMVLGALALLTIRRRGRRPAPAPIVVARDVILLPRGRHRQAQSAVAVADVSSIEERGTGARRVVVVGTADGPLVYPCAAFVDADGPAKLRAALREALAARPDGEALVATLAAREAYGRAVMARRPWGTRCLLAAIAAVFCVELGTNAFDDRAMLLRLGANAPVLVHQGQWWRLLTANLLHLSFIHFYFNAVALLSLGTLLERPLGTARLLAAALVGGLAGNAASAVAGRHGYSAGASAMAFGLMGALLVANLLHRRRLPAGFVLGWRQWAWLLGINAAISLVPGVDGLAHAGGLVGGALVMLVLAWRVEPPRVVRAGSVALAAGLTAIYLAGVGAAARHVATAVDTPRDELVRALLETPGFDQETMNNLAWAVAIDPASSPELLARAEETAARAERLDPENGNCMDTRAYLLFRVGRADEALALERRAAWTTASPPIVTMLGRLLALRRGEPVSGARIERDDGALVVRAEHRPGAVVYATVRRGDDAVGVLRAVLPAGAGAARAPWPPDLPRDATFEPLLVDATPERPEQPTSAVQVVFVPRDAPTLALPLTAPASSDHPARGTK